ncbi:hypothetical protein OAL05_00495 [bacterium]|nr:hypothetical protein [bacterium]
MKTASQMIDSRIYDRIFLLEKGDRWRNAMVSSFGLQVPIDVSLDSNFSLEETCRYQVFAIEFSSQSLKNCLSIFDKIDLSVENRFAILLDGPTGRDDRNVFREIGFVAFVNQISELDQVERLLELSKKRIQPTVGWRSKLENQIPWPEFATASSDFPRNSNERV